MRFAAALLVVALTACGGKRCTEVRFLNLTSIPGICDVSANCGGEYVQVDCSQSGAACSCRSDGGTVAASSGFAKCDSDKTHEMLKLCGFED